MNQEMIKLIDLSLCTACRGCQVACKQWNELPGSKTHNFGSYQNPPDLQWNTWTLVRFQEIEDRGGNVKWLFRKDGCMHCTDAACIKVCPTGALYHTEFGSVNLNVDKCIGCKACMPACPFGVPKMNPATNKIGKCTLCYNRLAANQPPACVQTCLSGAVAIGERDTMLKKAYKRVKELGGDASVYGDKILGGTHVIYVLPEKVEVYDELPKDPKIPLTLIAWKDVLKPAGLIGAGAVVAGAFLHYITHGPKTPDEETTDEGGKS